MTTRSRLQPTPLWMSLILLASLPGIASAASGDRDRVGFTILMMDKQFFTTPYERAATVGGAYMGQEGSADAVIKNPAGLGRLAAPEAMTYWVFSSYGGNGGANGPNSNEAIRGQLSDEGGYFAMPIPSVPVVIGVGADYLASSFSDAPVTQPSQRGHRVSGALAARISDRLTVGYGLTHLNDHHAWGTSWPVPGVLPPPIVHWVNDSESWRHRIGIQHELAGLLTWGLQGDFGHGGGDNLWNGKPTGGSQALTEYGLRLGAKSAPFHGLALLLDLEWRHMRLDFGDHEPMVGRTVLSQYAGDVYRLMLGFDHTVNEMLRLRLGYRTSMFRMDDFCYRNARQDYHTAAAGADFMLWNQRLELAWNVEYSWMAAGDFMNTVALRFRF